MLAPWRIRSCSWGTRRGLRHHGPDLLPTEAGAPLFVSGHMKDSPAEGFPCLRLYCSLGGLTEVAYRGCTEASSASVASPLRIRNLLIVAFARNGTVIP